MFFDLLFFHNGCDEIKVYEIAEKLKKRNVRALLFEGDSLEKAINTREDKNLNLKAICVIVGNCCPEDYLSTKVKNYLWEYRKRGGLILKYYLNNSNGARKTYFYNECRYHVNDVNTLLNVVNDGEIFNIGDYVFFGIYLNKQILWKCIDSDKNGFLLLSENVICIKPFDSAKSGTAGVGEKALESYGSNTWCNSNIREWLNSSNANVNYSSYPPAKNAVWNNYNFYDEEPGFLSNFKNEDIQKISTSKRNGISDRVFILSKNEVEKYFPKKIDRIKCLSSSAEYLNNYKKDSIKRDISYSYWVNTPTSKYSFYVNYVNEKGDIEEFEFAYKGTTGLVPALYIKSNFYVSGSGTKIEPFLI